MLFANEQMTAQMGQLLDEGRRYWDLQKKYLGLHLAEVLTRLLSTVALVLTLILVGSLVLLFGSFAMAYWLGNLTGSTTLGFGIIAAVLVLIAVVVYANRMSWIVLPTTRFMVSLLASSLAVPSQEGIAMEKAHLSEQLDANQRDMKDTATSLLAPPPESKNRWDTAANLFQNGMSIYRGIQLGVSAIVALRSVFKLGRRRRK